MNKMQKTRHDNSMNMVTFSENTLTGLIYHKKANSLRNSNELTEQMSFQLPTRKPFITSL